MTAPKTAPTRTATPRPARQPQRRRAQHGFTLIELLVVISIIAVLIGLLLPALGSARRSAQVAADLSNQRQIGIGQQAWAVDHRDLLLGWGTELHSAAHPVTPDPVLARRDADGHDHEGGEQVWIDALAEYSDGTLLMRSPLDTSEHWDVPITDNDGESVLRRTSYGLNDFLTPASVADAVYDTFGDIRNPTATVGFLIMAEEGAFAVADHPHASEWSYEPFDDALGEAAEQIAINLVDRKTPRATSRSNYGFLDGHAETLPFDSVFDGTRNRFDPAQAR